MPELLFPENGYIFDTITPIQKEFIDRLHADGSDRALDWLAEVKHERELTAPQALQFAWVADGSPSYRFALSEDPDFTCPDVYTTAENRITIENLKIDTVYYWRVNDSAVRSFQTAKADFRFIHIDGLLNVRDFGGRTIKQGLLYRGTAMDVDPAIRTGPSMNSKYILTEKGIKTFRDELKIKTEVELRNGVAPAATESPIPGIERIYAPYRPYLEVFEDTHRQGICKIMQLLTDETKYPMYIHCRGGADRTGMIALYLRALTGECDEIIHIDYELTSLSNYTAGEGEGVTGGFRNHNAPYYADFLKELQKYAPGEPLSVCVKNFLLDCGVTQEQIDRIKAIIQK